MEAMCPQCGMHYEVPEELFQQSPQVACPTCQVVLIYVQPGTNIPLEPQPQAGTLISQTESTPPSSFAPEPPQVETEKVFVEAQQPPATGPSWPDPLAEPNTGGWTAGDLLWSGMEASVPSVPAQTSEAGQEKAPPAEAPLSESAEPPAREQAALEMEQLQQAPPPLPPEEAFPAPAPEEKVLPSAGQMETTTAAVEPQATPVQHSASEPVVDSSPAAPEPATPAFETPIWQPMDLAATSAEQASTTTSTSAPPSVSTQPPSSFQEDWASAAARWAASGFAPEAMPEFLKRSSSPQNAAQSFPPPESQATTQTSLQPLPEPAKPESVPSAGFAPPVFAPLPPPKAVTPPPISPSTPAGPPPLSPPPIPQTTKPAGTSYIMRGSGEGLKEEAPWSSAPVDSVPPKPERLLPRVELPKVAAMPISLAKPEENGPRPKPAPVEVPRPPKSKVGLVLTIVILCLAAALGGLWYFMGPPAKWLEAIKSWLPRPEDKLIEVPSAQPSSVAKPVEMPAPVPSPTSAPAVEPPPQQPTPSPSEEKPAEAGAPAGPKTVTAPPEAKPAKPQAAAVKPAAKANDTAMALKLYQDGNRLVKEKKLAEAVAAYKKALAADPKFILAHRGLGIVYAMLGRNQDACREYRIYYQELPADSKEKPQLEAILKGCR